MGNGQYPVNVTRGKGPPGIEDPPVQFSDWSLHFVGFQKVTPRDRRST